MLALKTARKAVAIVAVATPLLASLAAQADQIALTPVQDTTLIQENPNYANGAGTNLFIGAISSGQVRRALLKFDLSVIPAGSQITDVSLKFLLNRAARNSALDDQAALHRLTANWGEGTSATTGGGGDQASPQDATWLYRFYGGSGIPQLPWSFAGGDFNAIASGSVTIGSIGYYQIPSTPQLIADVQAWIAAPATNFGWIMLGPETDQQDARRITSRESGSSADRPTLTITFTPAAQDADAPLPPWSLGLLGLGLLGIAKRVVKTVRE